MTSRDGNYIFLDVDSPQISYRPSQSLVTRNFMAFKSVFYKLFPQFCSFLDATG